MSLQSQFDRLELAKENWQAVLEYHEAPPESTDLFSDYYDYLAGIYFCEIPETVDYGYGYVDGTGWKYEDKGYVANPIDIYKIKKDHEYFILRGADSVNATRFRVCTVNEDIRLKTSGSSCMQAINNENAPTTAYATMTKYSNPDYSNAKTPFFKAADDGWLLIQKDNAGTLGLSCYVFDLTTPVPMSDSDSGHMMDESLFDIDSNGIITFKSSVDKSTISGRKGIPDTVNGVTVTGFGDHCFDGTSIAAIEMPSTVTSFGDYAFKGCPFVYFTIPSTVTNIGDYAFENCNLIREVTVPATATTIGVGLFKNCTTLSNAIILGARNTLDETFYNCYNCYFNLPSILTVTNGAFYGNTKLLDLTKFPDVVTIGSNAFNGCTGLTSLTIPTSVTSIGANAFANCTSLTDINLSVTTPPTLANANAFANTNNCPIYVPDAAVATYKAASGWSDLESRIYGVSDKDNVYTGLEESLFNVNSEAITLKSTVTKSSLTGKKIIPSSVSGSTVTKIGSAAFQDCINLVGVSIPNGVTEIMSYGFVGCTSLEEVILPNSLLYMREGAFYNCTSLEEIVMPNTVTTVENYAFDGCTSLEDVTLSTSLTSIGIYAFRGTAISSITIPASVTSILGSSIFKNCSNLTQIHMASETPPTLRNSAGVNGPFDEVPNSFLIVVPDSAVNAYKTAESWAYYPAYVSAIVGESSI